MSPKELGVAGEKKGQLVLAVDDAPESLSLIEVAVTDGGYVFYGAASGRDCFDLIDRVTPKVILLDVEMPEMDGFEVCKRLRIDKRLTHVPILFLTAHKTVEAVRKGLAVGGNDFILKPFDIAKLQARLRHWMAQRVGLVRYRI
jgi:DNA-binding response OmpR family regulator